MCASEGNALTAVIYSSCGFSAATVAPEPMPRADHTQYVHAGASCEHACRTLAADAGVAIAPQLIASAAAAGFGDIAAACAPTAVSFPVLSPLPYLTIFSLCIAPPSTCHKAAC